MDKTPTTRVIRDIIHPAYKQLFPDVSHAETDENFQSFVRLMLPIAYYDFTNERPISYIDIMALYNHARSDCSWDPTFFISELIRLRSLYPEDPAPASDLNAIIDEFAQKEERETQELLKRFP